VSYVGIAPNLDCRRRRKYVLFLKLALTKVGMTNPVCVVDNGQDAIDYLAGVGRYADRVAYPKPFLVLLDLKLPCVNGVDVLLDSFGQRAVQFNRGGNLFFRAGE
jgi:hypothetical protein